MKFDRTHITIAVVALFITLVTTFGIRYLNRLPADNFHKQFFTAGYNFRRLQDSDDDFSKYKVGDRIDVTKVLFNSNNNTVNRNKANITLLVVVDPACSFVKISSDISTRVREAFVDSDVAYLPVIFTSFDSGIDLSGYAKSLGFDDILVWDTNNTPPELLRNMPTPAHILIDKEGTILQVWFSSSRDEEVRKRMSEQIISDVSLIKNIVDASSLDHKML